MADESASQYEGSASQPNADPVAWAALSAASREKADGFLQEQTILVRLQAKELEHELRLRHWSLRVRHLSDVLKLTFEVGLALIVIAVVTFAGAIVWGAAHDHGVVVEAFQVPQDFTNRGVTGEALAGDILAALAKMQAQTDSARPAHTYQNNWSDDFKVQIADTGISLGEINRYLHQWLGHQTRISGELARDPDGIAVTVRVGDTRATFEGAEKDRDALLQKAAEAIYGETQPYRYGAYLVQRGRFAEGRAIFRPLTTAGATMQERAWAFVGLGTADLLTGDVYGATANQYKSTAIMPDFVLPVSNEESFELQLGHDEAAHAAGLRALQLFSSGHDVEMSANARMLTYANLRGDVDAEAGDYLAALRDEREAIALPDYADIVEASRENIPVLLAQLHDRAAALQSLRSLPAETDASHDSGVLVAQVDASFYLANWNDVETYVAAGQKSPPQDPILKNNEARFVWPFMAAALAETGQAHAARALIDKVPLDCMICTLMRGRVDEVGGNPDGAGYWYAQAVLQAPSIPLPYAWWGAMLLHHGLYDAAIGKFEQAHDKGPHFADPLEMWGEALMLKKRSDLALPKFEEAAKYAPNWGRLHLEWGEALFYAGRADESKKQIAIAASLDFSPSERFALTAWTKAHG